ncbi:MAG: STAS/SEC14 domain-containing protein [Rhizobiaceae bacterium]
MLEVYKVEDNMVGIKIDGEIDAQTMKDGLNKLVELTQNMKNGRMLYHISNFQMPTFAALGVEMRLMPKLFGLISKIDHVALLTNESWISAASKIESALIPGLEIRTFALGEDEEALSYLRAS